MPKAAGTEASRRGPAGPIRLAATAGRATRPAQHLRPRGPATDHGIVDPIDDIAIVKEEAVGDTGEPRAGIVVLRRLRLA